MFHRIFKKLFVKDADKCFCGIVCPLVVDGDVVGGIVMLISENGSAPSDTDMKVVNNAAMLLVRQLEA